MRPARLSAGRGGHVDVNRHGLTIWLTGLSGAGKTTIATRVASTLGSRGLAVEVLDGDAVRRTLNAGLGFTKEDRDTNVRRLGYVAELLTHHGVVVIVAAISPYREAREEVRAQIGSFLEVYVRCSVDELVRRDVKGLYARAIAGEIDHFTGVSDPYEVPERPDVLVDTALDTVEESVARVLQATEDVLGSSIPFGAATTTVGSGA